MQEVIFGKRTHGAKDGRPYDLVELSDGFQSFTVENGVGSKADEYKKGDSVKVSLLCSGSYRGLVAKLVDITEN